MIEDFAEQTRIDDLYEASSHLTILFGRTSRVPSRDAAWRERVTAQPVSHESVGNSCWNVTRVGSQGKVHSKAWAFLLPEEGAILVLATNLPA